MFLFSKQAFGIDISDYSVELLELKKTGTMFEVASYARKLLPGGIVGDGDIKDKGAFVNSLGNLVEDAKPRSPSVKGVIASLPESKTFIHVFTFPSDLRPKEISEAVENEAQKLIPVGKNDVYFDIRLGEKREKGRDVLYAACPKHIVNGLESVFASAGFDLVALDLESASVARAVVEGGALPPGPICIIDVGARTTNITIYEDGLIRFSTVFFMGGLHLTQELSHKLGVLPEKAEVLKRTIGLNPEKEGGKVMLVLQNLLKDLAGEVRHVRELHEKKSRQKIQTGFLAGGGSLLPGLVDYLTTNTGINFSVADPLGGVESRGVLDIESEDAFSLKSHTVFFVNVMGLALRGAGPDPARAGINLLPKKESNDWKLNFLGKFNFPKLT